VSGILKGGISLGGPLAVLTGSHKSPTSDPSGRRSGHPYAVPHSLSNNNINENSSAGTVVGSIQNLTAGSSLSLSADGGGRFAISGTALVTTATATDYETATSHSITIVETLAGAIGTPKSTTLTIGVVNLNDTNPTAFTFTDVTGVPLATTETSNTITVAGLGASDTATASISGDPTSQLQKNGGAWVSGPVSVVNTDTLAVRHTSSGSNSVAISTTLTVGTASDTFTSTTTASVGGTAVTYDTRFGTDSPATITTNGGWFTFGLRAGSRRVWCDSSRPDDSGDGLSAATAKKTLMAAWALFTNGSWTAGDQLMLAGKGGRTYTDDGSSTGWFNFASQPTLGTAAATYPTAVLCYDPASPADTTKYGKLLGSDRPIFLTPDPAVLAADPNGAAQSILSNGTNGDGTHGGFAVQGLILSGGDYDRDGVGTQGKHDYVCWQNCQLKRLELGNGTEASVAFVYNISKCSFYGMWNAANGNTSGLFSDNIDGLYCQDNVFAHCGWKMSSSRDDAFADGGPFYLGHSNYYTAWCTNGRFDRNVYIDSASDGWGLRGNANATQLVSIDEPIVGALTGFSNVYTERPGGSTVQVNDAVAMGGGDIAPNAIKAGNDLTRGAGVGGRNALLGTITNMVLFDNPKYGTPNNYTMLGEEFDSGQVSQTYAYDKIRTYNFSPIAQYRTFLVGDAAKVSMTWTNSLLDGLAALKFVTGGGGQSSDGSISGTGVRTWTAGDYPSAMTKNQVITALGFSSKAAMVNAMLDFPHLSWAQAIIGIVFPAFGATPLYATASVPSLTGLPTPTVVYKTSLGALSLSTLNFTRGTASSALITGTSTNFLLSSSDLPSGFSIMGRRLSYDGTGTGAATPTIHVLETNNDGIGTNTTAFTLNISTGVVSTTWAAATDWTLTNGNLTAERTATADFWAPIKASSAKTNGTVIHTINAIGSAGLNSVGLSTGTVSGSLGSDASGNDIAYDAGGSVTFAGATVAGGPYATWTTADVMRPLSPSSRAPS
jgi:hypothetical protein